MLLGSSFLTAGLSVRDLPTCLHISHFLWDHSHFPVKESSILLPGTGVMLSAFWSQIGEGDEEETYHWGHESIFNLHSYWCPVGQNFTGSMSEYTHPVFLGMVVGSAVLNFFAKCTYHIPDWGLTCCDSR